MLLKRFPVERIPRMVSISYQTINNQTRHCCEKDVINSPERKPVYFSIRTLFQHEISFHVYQLFPSYVQVNTFQPNVFSEIRADIAFRRLYGEKTSFRVTWRCRKLCTTVFHWKNGIRVNWEVTFLLIKFNLHASMFDKASEFFLHFRICPILYTQLIFRLKSLGMYFWRIGKRNRFL